MSNDFQIAQLKQLSATIDALLEANEDVYYRCGNYSIFDDKVQQEAKEMLEFRILQFNSRSKLLTQSFYDMENK